MKKLLAIAFLFACGGSSSGGVVEEPAPEQPEVCNPAPQGFIAWRSGELVMVSKELAKTQSGVALQAEVHNISAASLPSVVDFGAEQLEVREDLSLCLVDG